MKETLDPPNNVRKGIITKDKKELVDLQLNWKAVLLLHGFYLFFFKTCLKESLSVLKAQITSSENNK